MNPGELRELENQIYFLREKLNHLGDNNTRLSDPNILKVSQELDSLLNKFESKKSKHYEPTTYNNRPEA
ncbi:aspartyl-phosphate phosphatase Spo0E family protein [Paenibacillus anaericanus]|uniref:Aspartyl-phosphate phosphatase Spo0E family protein n=1 Tax=Paenibacillus anaericanus TaxID=170367 RepID=A0A433XVU3_9BACL|nr:aspartyl-phosphate phosphatase Spo0E family protein [Paenibacillus anaericanus]RUT38723.1 aspartyl-phosphate phosphatase Spo0E family protein [Paenibacillus anaericanus]